MNAPSLTRGCALLAGRWARWRDVTRAAGRYTPITVVTLLAALVAPFNPILQTSPKRNTAIAAAPSATGLRTAPAVRGPESSSNGTRILRLHEWHCTSIPLSLAQMNAFPHAQPIGRTSPDSTIAALPGLSTDAQRHGIAVGIGRWCASPGKLGSGSSDPDRWPLRLNHRRQFDQTLSRPNVQGQAVQLSALVRWVLWPCLTFHPTDALRTPDRS